MTVPTRCSILLLMAFCHIMLVVVGCRNRGNDEEAKTANVRAFTTMHYTIRLHPYDYDNETSRRKASNFIRQLDQQRVDIIGRDIFNGYLDVRVGSDRANVLRTLVTQHQYELWEWNDRRQLTRPTCHNALARMQTQSPGYRIDSKYRNYDRLKEDFASLVRRYPRTSKMVELEEAAVQNLPGVQVAANERVKIFAIKLGQTATHLGKVRPAMFFNSLHHSRELLTGEVTFDLVEYLLTKYQENDPEVRFWLDHTDIWVVPIVNPLGYRRVFSEDPMWRKNWNPRTRTGVDLNRNYGFMFAQCSVEGSSSSDPQSQTYRGMSAFSEPESRIIDKFVGDIHPVFSISYHSTGEMVLFPYGCSDQMAPQRATLKYFAERIARAMPRDCHEGHYLAGESWDLLYATDGDDFSHFHEKHQVMSFLVEVSDATLGFQPPFDPWRNVVVQNVRPGWQVLMRQLWSKTIHGIVRDQDGGVVPGAQIMVRRLGEVHPGQQAMVTYTGNQNGSFYVPLLGGRYEVVVEANGFHRARTRDPVVIRDCSFPTICAPQLDVRLVREQNPESSSINVQFIEVGGK